MNQVRLSEHNKKEYVYLLTVICIFFFLYSFIIRYNYTHFGFAGGDLCNYVSICENTLRGRFLEVSSTDPAGFNSLSAHRAFFNIIAVFIYGIFKTPWAIMVSAVLGFCLSAVPLYGIVRRYFAKPFSLLLIVKYLLVSAIVYPLMNDFHAILYLPFFLMMCFYFWETENFRWFTVFLVLSLLVQENVGMTTALLSISGFFKKRKKRWIILPFVLSAVYFYFAFFANPFLAMKSDLQNVGAHTGIVQDFFPGMGNNFRELFLNIVLHPIKILKIIFKPQNVSYIYKIFFPHLFFIPFLGWEYMILVIPEFFKNLISAKIFLKFLHYHYSYVFAFPLFLAYCTGLYRIMKKNRKIQSGVFIFLTAWGIFSLVKFDVNSLVYLKENREAEEFYRKTNEFLKHEDGIIVWSHRLSSHYAGREHFLAWISDFEKRKEYIDKYYNYAIYDETLCPYNESDRKPLMENYGFKRVFSEGPFIFFSKKETDFTVHTE